MSQQSMRDELRETRPGMAARAAGGSRKAAIRLFCLECCGGQQAEVRRCPAADCFLYGYRMGAAPKKAKE